MNKQSRTLLPIWHTPIVFADHPCRLELRRINYEYTVTNLMGPKSNATRIVVENGVIVYREYTAVIEDPEIFPVYMSLVTHSNYHKGCDSYQG